MRWLDLLIKERMKILNPNNFVIRESWSPKEFIIFEIFKIGPKSFSLFIMAFKSLVEGGVMVGFLESMFRPFR